jgi:DNA ligase-associated metallophosphoesterase
VSTIEIHGEKLVLDHRRALVWPRQSALFIADTHFGKSAVFRREGIALPEGSDDEDLAIIGELLDEHRAGRLFVLGDFVHGALPRAHRFYRRFNEWRRGREIEVNVVLGNHDVHLDRRALPGIHWHSRLNLGPFELVHEPQVASGRFFFAGHIHPVFTLASRADALRMPVFWQRRDGLVLPSFGALTGGYAIRPARAERLYAVGPGQVTPLTPAGGVT